VDEPPDPDAQRSPRSGHRLPIDRAVILLGLFVLATVLLLGQIHPTTTTTSAAASKTADTHPKTTPAPHTSTTTTTAPKVKPANVPVLVANASGVTGAAAAITSQLQVAGWNVEPPINATANVTTSAVYYVAGQKEAATEVAAELHLPPSAVLPYTTAAPVTSMGTAEILVVAAPDLADSATATTTTTTGT
jgi:LytR cell envelope-related transcriptional attenuator